MYSSLKYPRGWCVLRVLLLGTKDQSNPWSKIPLDTVKKIWDTLVVIYTGGIEFTTHSFVKVNSFVQWPKPNDININMMPFIIGDNSSIPPKYRAYVPMLCRLPIENSFARGKVGYLTIHESMVQQNTSQRRLGIHTETPGVISEPGFYTEHARWGGGREIECHGGIFMGSNVPYSCRIWPVRIVDEEIIGKGGNIDHLRDFLGEAELMEEGIFWITDTTPHEARPNGKTPIYRQFLRVVSSDVSVWHSQHSTPNELGIQPAATILHNNKFDD